MNLNLKLERKIKTQQSTIGELSINGLFECFILEDVDRGLNSKMTLAQIQSIKVPHKTAIPAGTYNIVKYFSPKHQKYLPLLENVPGFTGIEIHVGNYPKDTDGCLLPGKDKGADEVLHSIEATEILKEKIFKALQEGKVVVIEVVSIIETIETT
ncbi:DUF5675 family protein [Mucilaginibacter angelicae]|uniref:DUF5675 family protein n=1 Tax=Mucilaginibacter angelicae TaxID=869718 RepID=A0ABV6LEB7_9SPHI